MTMLQRFPVHVKLWTRMREAVTGLSPALRLM